MTMKILYLNILLLCTCIFTACNNDKIVGDELLSNEDKFKIETFVQVDGAMTRASETDAGLVTGGGLYDRNADCTVTAIPKSGYVLESFTNRDGRYSGSNSYNFKVEQEEKFIAKFKSAKSLVFTVETTVENQEVYLPRIDGSDFTVDFGDGNKQTYSGNIGFTYNFKYYTYSTIGTHTITISTPNPITYLRFFGEEYTSEQKPSVKRVISNSLDMSSLTSISYCFGSTDLESICDGFFDSCKGSATEAEYVFNKCKKLQSIPENLFKDFNKVTSFYGCFRDSGLKRLPKTTFTGCTSVKEMNEVFMFSELSEIEPGALDALTNAEDFTSCFSETKITQIPNRLFSNCKKALELNDVFWYCNDLVNVPIDIFDGCGSESSSQYLFLKQCFYGCKNITSAVPDLWNKTRFPKVTTGTAQNAYYNVMKASNRSEIPYAFRGDVYP